jgi:predicted phosphodiesterase
MEHVAPDTHIVKGTSSLYKSTGENGKPVLQWVKTNVKAEQLSKVAEQLVESLVDEIAGKSKTTKAPKVTNTDLLTVYPMGDPHIGMYAWQEECGEDFDCDIAERDLQQAVDYLVEKAPPSKEAVIVNLGDFFHSDTLDNMTRRSGNVLDVDSRWPRVMRIGVRIMCYIIDRALEKHQKVTVINEIGNHDDQSAYMLSLVLDAYYRNNKRVYVDLSPQAFHYYRFGKVFLGVTHGHNCKPDMLGQIMAADKPAEWGDTVHRYWYVGHIHHQTAKEVPGCTIESFRTLAAKDAYHASKGYRSGRDMMCIIHHKDHGEVGRHRFAITMVKQGAA